MNIACDQLISLRTVNVKSELLELELVFVKLVPDTFNQLIIELAKGIGGGQLLRHFVWS